MASSFPSAETIEDHPLVDDVNAIHRENLSVTERICKRVADATGAPIALLLAVVVQAVWLTVGQITRSDPYPFAFLLTCSNILQLILIFVIAVAQRQSSEHAELRAEADHDNISRLLYHQQVQEQLLLRLAEKTQTEVADLRAMVARLVSENAPVGAV